jgi:hypothetical protein
LSVSAIPMSCTRLTLFLLDLFHRAEMKLHAPDRPPRIAGASLLGARNTAGEVTFACAARLSSP